MRLQRDGVGHHAEYADKHKREAESSKCSNSDQTKLRARVDFLGQKALDRSVASNGCVRIHRPDLALNACQQRFRGHGGSCDDKALAYPRDRVREERLRRWRFLRAAVLKVRNHTNYLEISVVRGAGHLIKGVKSNFLPERIIVSKISMRKSLVNDSDAPL